MHTPFRRTGLYPSSRKAEWFMYASKNFSDTKRSKGRAAFTKQGIGTVSTFRGFCGKHDNELFAPIDAFPFTPSAEQATLYAYRSVCREVFFKENSVALFRDLRNSQPNNKANKGVFDAMLKGSAFALKNLTAAKGKVRSTVEVEVVRPIKSVLFHSLQAPAVVFSGLLYPDYDFLGKRLQDLNDHSCRSRFDKFFFRADVSRLGLSLCVARQTVPRAACLY